MSELRERRPRRQIPGWVLLAAGPFWAAVWWVNDQPPATAPVTTELQRPVPILDCRAQSRLRQQSLQDCTLRYYRPRSGYPLGDYPLPPRPGIDLVQKAAGGFPGHRL